MGTKHHAIAAVALSMAGGHYGAAAKQHAPHARPAQRVTPTAYNALVDALKDADQWWTAQGSAPPKLDLRLGGAQSGAGATAVQHSGQLNVDPQSLASLNTYLQSGSRKAKLKALTMIWGLAAHERGHNIGYPHGASPLMQDGVGALPGRATEWAVSVLGPAEAKKRRLPPQAAKKRRLPRSSRVAVKPGARDAQRRPVTVGVVSKTLG